MYMSHRTIAPFLYKKQHPRVVTFDVMLFLSIVLFSSDFIYANDAGERICSQLRTSIPNKLHPPFAGHQRLLIISMDGFRYDLMNETSMPILHRWIKSGTHFINGVYSQYPSDTGPNHESIATGLTAESHGIVANMFYDSATGETFDLFNHSKKPNVVAKSKDQKWYTATPIWEVNRLDGGKSAIVKWPLRNEKGENKEGTYFKEFDSRVRSVDALFEKVADIEKAIDCEANLIVWYIEEPDSIQHEFGQYFEGKLKTMFSELDELFGRFLERMEKRVLCIDDAIAGIAGVDYNVSDTSIFTQSQQQTDDIFNNLTDVIARRNLSINIYRKSEMPSWWHYNHPSRVGDIVHEPGLGFEVWSTCKGYSLDRDSFHASTHGADPRLPEMRGILAMVGPSFKKNHEIKEIPQNIDLFPLMSRVIGVHVIPPSEGSVSRVEDALNTNMAVASYSSTVFLSLLILFSLY